MAVLVSADAERATTARDSVIQHQPARPSVAARTAAGAAHQQEYTYTKKKKRDIHSRFRRECRARVLFIISAMEEVNIYETSRTTDGSNTLLENHQVANETCRLCLGTCTSTDQRWALFAGDLSQKLMAFAAVQVRLYTCARARLSVE